AGLVHVIDMATWEPNRDPVTDLTIIETELAAYAVDLDDGSGLLPLSERPKLVALNKVDIPDGRDLADIVRPDLEAAGYRVFEISAVSHAGLRELSFAMPDSGWPSANGAGQTERPRTGWAARRRPSASRASGSGPNTDPTGRCSGCSETNPAGGCSRRTSATTKPSAIWPTGSKGSESRTPCSRPEPNRAMRSSSAATMEWSSTGTRQRSAAPNSSAP